MYEYLKGVVTHQGSNYITLENSGIGYLIYTPNPYTFSLDSETIAYVYSHIREDEHSLYGFKTREMKMMFLKLISVKGLGPKMALPILASDSMETLIEAIEKENILYLKKFPKIGDKVARQIILDLKGKLVTQEANNVNQTNELVSVLISLGYKMNDIKPILGYIDVNLKLEDQIKQALKLLLK